MAAEVLHEVFMGNTVCIGSDIYYYWNRVLGESLMDAL